MNQFLSADQCAICTVLESRGWTLIPSEAAIAYKMFATAVGEKVAHVYVSRGDGVHQTLFGEYISEGRNIVENRGKLIPLFITDDLLKPLVESFIADVEAAIADSYAVKLMRFF